MSHKQFILEYCGDLFAYLFIFGGIVFIAVEKCCGLDLSWEGLTIRSKIGVVIKKIMNVFFS